MSEFRFKARDRAGKEVAGTVSADNLPLAQATLRDRGYSELVLLEAVSPGILAAPVRLFERVKARDLVVFARQLSVMESANVPLVQSLKTVARQTVSRKLQSVLLEIADDVEAGSRLSLAFGRHPKVFSDFYVNMVRSGETTGRLDEVLTYLADQQEKDYDLGNKIRGAMMYPAFILTGMVAVGAVMMIFVIPRLTDILAQSGGTLPLSTRILIATSTFLSRYWWALIIGTVLAVIGFRAAIARPRGRFIWDSFKIKVPIFGFLFKRIYLVRMCRSLTTLTSGGVELVPALSVAADVVGNAVYRDLILQTRREVEDGHSVVSVFSRAKQVPIMFSQMLAVGEETGKVGVILERLSAFYTREIDNFVANLSTIIEPLIMVVLGVGVGLMVAAIILPMYNLSAQF